VNALEQLREQVQMIHASWANAKPAAEPRVAKITIEVVWPLSAVVPVGRFREARGRVNAVEIGGVPPGHLFLRGIATQFRPVRWTTYRFEYRSERWDQGGQDTFLSFDFAALLESRPEVING
jgi:hypothetical protein